MSEVWYGDAFRKTEMRAAGDKDQIRVFIEANRLMRLHGTAPTPDIVPSKYFWPYVNGEIKPPADGLFKAAGNLMVTKKCAEIMRPFDFGDGYLHECWFYQNDQTTKLPDPYYALVFGASKTALIPDRSTARPNSYNDKLWDIVIDPKYGDAVVSSDALTGADIWIDPTVSLGFFVSGALYDALKTAGFANNFYFSQCEVVTDPT